MDKRGEERKEEKRTEEKKRNNVKSTSKLKFFSEQ